MDETWGHKETILSVFLSSPCDVANERDAVDRVIDDINRSVGDKLSISLRLKRWERFRPRGENVMAPIERQLKNCDLFIMIFSRRFGCAPAPGTLYSSGTEQEYELAAKLHDSSPGGRPELFVYFRKFIDQTALEDPGPQLAKVLAFKKRIEKTRFYKEYHSPETFPFELKDHLIDWLLEVAGQMHFDKEMDRKRTLLSQFFRLGSSPGERPSALMVYPSASKLRGDIKVGGDPTHLLPYMVAEDFQAIHKLSKCLSIAGCDRVHACTENSYDPNHHRVHNKVFVCRRNMAAAQHLRDLPTSRFRLTSRSEGDTEVPYLVWRSEQEKEIDVESPQALYLQMQRTKDAEWITEPGRCVSVDFAILARFWKEREGVSETYVAGIRGLGTWGAAWYLDQSWQDMAARVKPDADYQALLRVTYRDHRIAKVEDVSARDSSFFRKEMEKSTILATLTELRPL
jgi:hypothetical protein